MFSVICPSAATILYILRTVFSYTVFLYLSANILVQHDGASLHFSLAGWDFLDAKKSDSRTEQLYYVK